MTAVRRRERIAWELSGLVGPNGALERPLRAGGWERPRSVELAADRLLFRFGDDRVAPASGMLERFAGLASAPDAHIVAYARRWGALGVCRHGIPVGHQATYEGDDCTSLAWSEGWEPLHAWRLLAGEARALLTIASGLQQGKKALAADWQRVPSAAVLAPMAALLQDEPERGDDERYLDSDVLTFALGCLLKNRKHPHVLASQPEHWQLVFRLTPLGDDPAFDRHVLAVVVNVAWLGDAGAAPELHWAESAPELRVGGRTLLGALAAQLAFAVCGDSHGATCSGCGRPYAPPRRPRDGQRRYCADCRTSGVPARDAARAYRARKLTAT